MKPRTSTCRYLLGLWALLGVLSLSSVLRAADAPAAPAQAAGTSGTVVYNVKEYGDANPSAKIADQGDPGATLTGNASDVPAADAKVGLTVADMAAQIGQNKVAINFVWTLVTGFLVMFIQAGVPVLETSLFPGDTGKHQ